MSYPRSTPCCSQQLTKEFQAYERILIAITTTIELFKVIIQKEVSPDRTR